MVNYEDDLVELFNKMGIELRSVEPHVVKAWFDTDNVELLQWICTSITEDNYLPMHLEYQYSQLSNPDSGSVLQDKVAAIEAESPGIFNFHKNQEIVGHLEQELGALKEVNAACDKSLELARFLNKNLSKEMNKIESKLEEDESALNSLQKQSFTLARSLGESYKVIIPEFRHFKASVTTAEVDYWSGRVTTFADVKFPAPDFNTVLDQITMIKDRITKAKTEELLLKVKTEQFKAIEAFLNECKNKENLLELSAFESNIKFHEANYNSLLQRANESCTKTSAKFVVKPTLDYYNNLRNFYKHELKQINNMNDVLESSIAYFLIYDIIVLQETQDFKTLATFVNGIIQDVEAFHISKVKASKNQCTETGKLTLFQRLCEKGVPTESEHQQLKKDTLAMIEANYQAILKLDLKQLEEILSDGYLAKPSILSYELKTILKNVEESLESQKKSLNDVVKVFQKL